MPLASISAAAAYANLKRNPNSFWPGRDPEPTRLEPIAKPGINPSFKLRPGEKIFTIGSCFARNIEHHLRRLGYKIPAADYTPRELIGKPLDGFLNKFTPHSMLNEVSWALDPEAPFDPTNAFLQQPNGLFIDGQLMSKIEVTEERALERRQEITDVFRLIPQCRVVVLTLGLVEAWFDTKTGVYLNRSLPPHNGRAEPDRFELHVLSYDELLDATRRLVKLIIRYGHPETRLLLSVSPVPLTATFTDGDVLTANMYSKCALRTVAEHLCREFDVLDYFPSFESVMLSSRDITWKDDLIHVQDPIVAVNVGRMAELYAPNAAHAAIAASLHAKTLAAE